MFRDAEGTIVAELRLAFDLTTRLLAVSVGTCADESEQQINFASSTAGAAPTATFGIGLEIFQEEISDPPSQRRRLKIFLKNSENVFAYTDSDGHVTPEPLPEACITAMADNAVTVMVKDAYDYALNGLDAETGE